MSWMKIDAARAYAGGISRKVLYRAVASGQLRAARIGTGRSLLFCEAWIDEWLRGTVASAASEIAGTGHGPRHVTESDRPLRLVKSA